MLLSDHILPRERLVKSTLMLFLILYESLVSIHIRMLQFRFSISRLIILYNFLLVLRHIMFQFALFFSLVKVHSTRDIHTSIHPRSIIIPFTCQSISFALLLALHLHLLQYNQVILHILNSFLLLTMLNLNLTALFLHAFPYLQILNTLNFFLLLLQLDLSLPGF